MQYNRRVIIHLAAYALLALPLQSAYAQAIPPVLCLAPNFIMAGVCTTPPPTTTQAPTTLPCEPPKFIMAGVCTTPPTPPTPPSTNKCSAEQAAYDTFKRDYENYKTQVADILERKRTYAEEIATLDLSVKLSSDYINEQLRISGFNGTPFAIGRYMTWITAYPQQAALFKPQLDDINKWLALIIYKKNQIKRLDADQVRAMNLRDSASKKMAKAKEMLDICKSR